MTTIFKFKFKFAAVAAATLVVALVLVSAPNAAAQLPEDGNFGVGIPEVFVPRYLAYRSSQLASGTPDVMRVKLGYVKGISRNFTSMLGEAAINLGSGTFQVNLNQLTPLQTYTVWLVDRPEDDLLPDMVAGLVTFLATGPTALLSGLVPVNLPLGLTIDRVVITPGLVWGAEPLAAGTVSALQKMFFRRLSLVNESTGAVLFQETTPAPALFGLVPPLDFETVGGGGLLGLLAGGSRFETSASRVSDPATSSGSDRSVKLDRLISQGAELFFEETFRGNGRTCGTCHPAANNFTIDKAFIASRPFNDPLFVAEFNSNLAGLERPDLMREFGLILENVDGLENPTVKFTMRGVPHTLGLGVSMDQDPNATNPPKTPNPPAEMTGWSGDGAPGTGSLREFAIGAVTQHFTKDLQRVEGRDFRLPKEKQLDAMEAFQLSLGRSAEFNLASITFTNAAVNNGKTLFINGNGGGQCAACHRNAGANTTFAPQTNLNINTNVEDAPDHPARKAPFAPFPRDGGFGKSLNSNGTFGNLTFNIASVVEAADTPPFFHNNLTNTLEGVVLFYESDAFNNPRAPAAQFNFNDTERNNIADFMRGINGLQNIDVAKRELQEILANPNNPQREQNTRLRTAIEEAQDTIDVFVDGGEGPSIFPTAITRLNEARNLMSQALQTSNSSQRRTLIQQAITKLGQARTAIAT
jgi:cytochrome c peroxidase